MGHDSNFIGFSCQTHITIQPDTEALLRAALVSNLDSIVVTEQLFQLWTNGRVSKQIYFEHMNGFAVTGETPTREASPFSKVRWNVFNGYALTTQAIYNSIPTLLLTNSLGLFTFFQEHSIQIIIIPNTKAYEQSPIKLHDFFYPTKLIRKIEWVRHRAVTLQTILTNIKMFFTEKTKQREYQRAIAQFKIEKKMVIDLDGGLGDCLIYSTLPRLLSERYGMTVYLTEESKQVIRNPEIRSLCFDDNPYFGGYVKSSNSFRFYGFIHEGNFMKNVSETIPLSALEKLEAQFDVTSNGLPEIFYTPHILPELHKTLLIDANWHSGKKWGLYNDPSILDSIISQWHAQGPDFVVQYVETAAQDIYTYLDMIVSAAQFVSFFSGGNALAAALNIPAIIIVPENLDGTSLTMFLYHHAPITYVRRRSLARYGVYSKMNELIK